MPFAMVAQKYLPTQICVQHLIGVCVVCFRRALLKNGGVSIFHNGIHPRRTTALIFFQKGVGGSRFRCLIVMRRIDIYTSACDCGRHVWNRCL